MSIFLETEMKMIKWYQYMWLWIYKTKTFTSIQNDRLFITKYKKVKDNIYILNTEIREKG